MPSFRVPTPALCSKNDTFGYFILRGLRDLVRQRVKSATHVLTRLSHSIVWPRLREVQANFPDMDVVAFTARMGAI